MIKHIWKIIWNQRSSNGWIFAELVVVVAVLWTMMDSLLVDVYTYYSPLGRDTEQVYQVNIGKMSPTTLGYVPDSLKQTSDGEDLVRLAENLRQSPRVEEVGLGYAACPYSWSNSYSSLIRAEADTSEKVLLVQHFLVTPAYFDVFRIKSREGQNLRRIAEQGTGDVLLSADADAQIFAKTSGRGNQVKWGPKDNEAMTVIGISTPIRRNEYTMSEPCFFQLMHTDKEVAETANSMMAQNMDCLIRMKDGFRPEEMEDFLQQMSDRLTANNLYVSSVTPLAEYRTQMLKTRQDNMKKKLALVGFMLVNVFFGIVGTFWLRTQYRRGEMGLRTALGSTRSGLRRFMDAEGLSLLAFTVPLILIFIANVLFFDLPDTARLPFTWWRFAIAFGGSFGLLGIMVIVGIRIPARKIAKLNPAEALHYE